VTKLIERLGVILGLVNLALALFMLKIFLPKKVYKTSIQEFFQIFKNHLPYVLIIFVMVIIHLIEVNLLDTITTEMIGVDFANNIYSFEGDIVPNFSQLWTPIFLCFFVIMYMVLHGFTIWFLPFYLIIANEKKAVKHLAYGFFIIYAVALPFYLFLPITNVYVFKNIESGLEMVLPGIEAYFYSTTTQNNTFPSLHVAMTILLTWCAYQTNNKKLQYFMIFVMTTVIISVVYLVIHWISDVISGALLSIMAILILRKYIKE